VVGARWTALVVVALLAAGVAGCGSGESGTDVEKVALVVPGRDNEPDWTLQAKAVVADFPRQLGIGVDVADASGSDVAAVLEQVSHEGNQLVIAHDSRYAEAAETVAEKTDVPALVWGERPDPPDGLVGEITVQDKEGGYMAGIVAVKAAITRRLGIVVADDGSDWDVATWNRMAGGFVAGARSIDPKAEIYYEQAGTDGDATAEQMDAAAQRVLERGAQMLFILGGRTTIGAQRALEAREGTGETLFIGVVSDKSSTRRLEEAGVPYMLGSVIWEPKPAFRQAVRDVRAGTFGDRPYALTLRNRGVWLYVTGRTPGDAYEAAIEAQGKMSRGTLRVPATPTSDAVERLVEGAPPAG
jgi:basic membrane protein A